jgi:ParB family chromosome partitioning protein
MRPALGRGLSSLISSAPVSVVGPAVPALESNVALKVSADHPAVEAPAGGSVTAVSAVEPGPIFVAIERVRPNPTQPRQVFKEAELEELSNSIKTLGVLQPVLVRGAATGDGYEIIAGERRWRAAQRAGLAQLPVIVRDLSDRDTFEIALVENVQRENLNPVEEARAYQRLMDEFSLGQKEVAERVGKERATVANMTRLLKLPAEILDMLQAGEISVGHAKVLLTLREPAGQLSLARKIVKEGLSVRQLEGIVSNVVVLDAGKAGARQKSADGREGEEPDAFPEVVDRLRQALGTKVIIRHSEGGHGRIEIRYYSEQELDRVVEQICG